MILFQLETFQFLKIFSELLANILSSGRYLDAVLISIDKRSIQSGVTVTGRAGRGRGEELAPVGLIGAPTATTELGQAAPTARL